MQRGSRSVLQTSAKRKTSEEEKIAAFHKYIEAGVMVAPGVSFHVNRSQKGWMRVSFEVNEEAQDKGLLRIESVYKNPSISRLM